MKLFLVFIIIGFISCAKNSSSEGPSTLEHQLEICKNDVKVVQAELDSCREGN